MIADRNILSWIVATWGTNKTIQTALIGLCAMITAMTICASVIPNEPTQTKENER